MTDRPHSTRGELIDEIDDLYDEIKRLNKKLRTLQQDLAPIEHLRRENEALRKANGPDAEPLFVITESHRIAVDVGRKRYDAPARFQQEIERKVGMRSGIPYRIYAALEGVADFIRVTFKKVAA